MRTLNQLRSSFLAVQCSKSSMTVKKLLLQSIAVELRQMENQKNVANRSIKMDTSRCISTKSALQTSITSSPHYSAVSNEYSFSSRILSTSMTEQISIQQFEERIIQKQQVKLQLNEDIQTCEDDIYEMTKILLTKKEYDAKLDEIINTKTIQMNKLKIEKKPAEVKKSLGSRIKSFFK